MAEMCLRRRMETDDMLHLLAELGGVKDYDTPADRITEELDDLAAAPGAPGAGPSPDRQARIIAAADAAGGEVS